MLKKIKSFFLTAILGGLTVILPIAIIAMVMVWLVQATVDIISPITTYLTSNTHMQSFVANAIVIIFLVGVCFFVGLFEKTKLGKWFVRILDDYLLRRLPGYLLVKETIAQFIGNSNAPFSQVALVNIFGNESRCTAFVTDEHPDGSFTVFVPTGPNPTSGNICHLPARAVKIVDVPVEEAMKSIIGCGVGSTVLVEKGK